MGINDSAVSKCSKYFIFFTNFFTFLLALLLLIAGAYILHVKDKKITSFIDLVLDPSMLLVIAGSLGTFIAFCGWLGSLREYILLLQIYSILVNLLILVQILVITFIFIFAYSPSTLEAMNIYPSDILKDSVLKYRDDPDLEDTIDDIQRQLQCCGYSDNEDGYLDWNKNMYFNCTDSNPSFEKCGVPWSCCIIKPGDNVNLLCGAGALSKTNSIGKFAPKINKGGCLWALRTYFQNNFLAVGGVLIGSVILQMFIVYKAKDLIDGIKEQKKKWRYVGQQEIRPPSEQQRTAF